VHEERDKWNIFVFVIAAQNAHGDVKPICSLRKRETEKIKMTGSLWLHQSLEGKDFSG
jgi:hypothetical protein